MLFICLLLCSFLDVSFIVVIIEVLFCNFCLELFVDFVRVFGVWLFEIFGFWGEIVIGLINYLIVIN